MPPLTKKTLSQPYEIAIIPVNLKGSVEVNLIHQGRIRNNSIVFIEVCPPVMNSNEDDLLLFS